jgi:hypothetical protein
MSPTGFGPQNNCSGEDQQQLYMTDPSSRQTKTANGQLENKNSVRESQEACRQDELISGREFSCGQRKLKK